MWSIVGNATINSGQGTKTVTVSSSGPGSFTLSVTFNSSCLGSITASKDILPGVNSTKIGIQGVPDKYNVTICAGQTKNLRFTYDNQTFSQSNPYDIVGAKLVPVAVRSGVNFLQVSPANGNFWSPAAYVSVNLPAGSTMIQGGGFAVITYWDSCNYEAGVLMRFHICNTFNVLKDDTPKE